MPKLYATTTSPYVAKVRMAAAHAGYGVETVFMDEAERRDVLPTINPLGKLPTLVTDDGEAIFDSPLIVRYISQATGNSLYPRSPKKRLEAERLESLAQGMIDCLVAHIYERRQRPAELVHQPWLDRQWGKVIRSLDVLNAAPPKLGKKLHAGHIALRTGLGYLDFRFAGKWERGHAKLVRWAKRFDERFPELAAYLPHDVAK